MIKRKNKMLSKSVLCDSSVLTILRIRQIINLCLKWLKYFTIYGIVLDIKNAVERYTF